MVLSMRNEIVFYRKQFLSLAKIYYNLSASHEDKSDKLGIIIGSYQVKLKLKKLVILPARFQEYKKKMCH